MKNKCILPYIGPDLDALLEAKQKICPQCKNKKCPSRPIEVEEEVKKLWLDNELGNDRYYFKWDSETMNDNPSYEHSYPIIDEYLKSKGITECLIHWWW